MYALAQIKKEISANLSLVLNKTISPDDLMPTPNPEMGDLGLAIFPLAKELRENPAELASKIAEQYPKTEIIKAQATGPYLNFFITCSGFSKKIISQILETKENYGQSEIGQKEKIVLEFSNVNTHKEYHVGHLRNVCYGDSVTKILNASGFEAVPISYVNDFGIHVAKTLWDLDAYVQENLNGKKPEDLSEDERGFLLGKVYVDASQKEKADPSKTEIIGQWKQKIESRNSEEYALWQKTRLWSIALFASTYQDLNIKFKDTIYESEVVDEGKKIADELLAKGILKKSEGAVIADLKEYNLEVLVFIRSNGTATYSVADLALSREKHQRYNPDKSIVIVDNRQDLYFKQLFKVLELSGFSEKFLHLGYDIVKLPSGLMSSRTGNVVTFRDLKKDVLTACENETKKRHEDWSEEKIKNNALKISLGSIKFEMLKVEAQSVITFDIEKALSLEGFTSAYIQYAYARIQSIFRKIGNWQLEIGNLDFSKLTEGKEKELLKKLAYYPEIVEKAATNYNPSEIAKYTYELAQMLNDYYHAVPVSSAEEETKKARLALLSAVAQVIKNGLGLLGIETVEEM